MDKLDLAIYRSLIGPPRGPWNIRRSASSIANELHVDEMTVRARLRKMRESGFLDTRTMVNPSVVGETDYHLRFDVHPPSTKDEAIRKLKLVDGVYLIRSYFGNLLAVNLDCADDSVFKRRRELIARIANSEEMSSWVERYPRCEIRLDEYDFKIIRSLYLHPLKHYALVANDAGLSTKTVRRRVKRLIEGKAVILAPSLDLRRLSGLSRADLLIDYEAPRSRLDFETKLLTILGDRAMRLALELHHDHVFVPLMLTNISEVKEILDAVKKVDGVKKVYLDLAEERIELYGIFLEELVRAEQGVRSPQSLAQHVLRESKGPANPSYPLS